MEQSQQAIDAASLAAQTILECSGEIYRAEETALRICEAYGFPDADIICFPTGFTLHVLNQDGHSLTRVKRIRDRSIQLEALDGVNSISRQSCDGLLTAAQALEALEKLRAAPNTLPAFAVLAFASSAGFFSVMFGGGLLEFFLSFVAGGFAKALIPLLVRLHSPSLLISMTAGFIAALSTLGLIRLFGGNQEAIIAGAIMPLLPGLAITNAVRDTMRGDLIAGMARTSDALLSAVLIAAGVAVALML